MLLYFVIRNRYKNKSFASSRKKAKNVYRASLINTRSLEKVITIWFIFLPTESLEVPDEIIEGSEHEPDGSDTDDGDQLDILHQANLDELLSKKQAFCTKKLKKNDKKGEGRHCLGSIAQKRDFRNLTPAA